MTYELHRHDAAHVSDILEPESVDLIVTSPPYFALRSYQDGGEHYDGQIGSEPTPTEFVDALIACTADWLRVLRPGGSIFVNLGDKYAGSGGHNNGGIAKPDKKRPGAWDAETSVMRVIAAARRSAPDRYTQASDGIPAKSLMGLPWRYALRCVDELGLILRAEIIWSKPNGLPESVTDRVRRSHEQWFHFTRQGRYFAAIDEVREAHDAKRDPKTMEGTRGGYGRDYRLDDTGLTRPSFAVNGREYNPLGKVPGSVWTIPSEPLVVPDDLGVDHFAAFPSEWPRRIILGWSPSGYCTACDEPRQAVVEKGAEIASNGEPLLGGDAASAYGIRPNERRVRTATGYAFPTQERTIIGYVCACPDTTAPTRPARVLDPFTGTGTTPAVAHLLGRHGIGTDLSNDYLRLAEWRCTNDLRLRDKVLDRSGIPNPDPPKIDGQLSMFGETS